MANTTLARAFARASNVSTTSVTLGAYGAARRKLLVTDTAHFSVALLSLDALDALYERYAIGDGNASVDREFSAIGLRARGAVVTFGTTRASIGVRAGGGAGAALLERARNASTIELMNALSPPGMSVVAGAPPVFSGRSDGVRVKSVAFAAFATAPALVFAIYVFYVRVRGGARAHRGGHSHASRVGEPVLPLSRTNKIVL
jgi:hypothetical protein